MVVVLWSVVWCLVEIVESHSAGLYYSFLRRRLLLLALLATTRGMYTLAVLLGLDQKAGKYIT